MNIAALILLGATAVAPLLLGHRRIPMWISPAVTAALATAAAILAGYGDAVHGFAIGATAVLSVAAAALGGLPFAPLAFRIARRQSDRADPADSADLRDTTDPGPLRGGLMIGVFERIAIVVTVLAGWPEGIVVVLGVKGLARYPELREPKPHASEQFIIGTFASVLWALAIGGIGRGMFT
ncbi:hypothetical protein OG921_26020 [Aldersonia sp. NBC_00410]|uniref:hypothetical protein n=1 Tax=Aldersonia sp. NBC_00410 TaxID=2975954 RepID=UPI00224ECC2C|nr:hypothetical protein [Aldersonia sp. NBC_00410]MCX5046635.1 hypothetical protein [Aldersonia sp. NBC_00410]